MKGVVHRARVHTIQQADTDIPLASSDKELESFAKDKKLVMPSGNSVEEKRRKLISRLVQRAVWEAVCKFCQSKARKEFFKYTPACKLLYWSFYSAGLMLAPAFRRHRAKPSIEIENDDNDDDELSYASEEEEFSED